MKLRVDRASTVPIHRQLRDQIQSALHVGELRPGDRLPSLREMSQRHGVNPKTVLRAYRALQDQGLVEIRPGSGAIVGGETINRPDEQRALSLLRMARRHRAEAEVAGLTPPEHRRLLSRLDGNAAPSGERTRTRVVFLECNGELATICAREITRRVKTLTFPLVLPAAGESAEAILRMADLWVTTDFHYQEVRTRAAKNSRPCLTLRLDPQFSRTILKAAGLGSVIMVHPDPSIVPAFIEVLADAGAPRETLARIHGLAAGNIEEVRRGIARAQSVYVSPLCPDEIRALVPRPSLLPVPRWMLAAASIEALRAMILTLPALTRE